jgi:YcaO-like protein with predicted kinase domain
MSLHLKGTIRQISPRETIERARSVFANVGITRVANVTGLDSIGVPTWIAVRPLARSLSVSQGKGLTHELAVASAVMECIEFHHAEMGLRADRTETITHYLHDENFGWCPAIANAAWLDT